MDVGLTGVLTLTTIHYIIGIGTEEHAKHKQITLKQVLGELGVGHLL